MAKSRTFLEHIQAMTWQTLLILAIVVGWFFYKLVKSPTFIGDFLSRIFNPSEAQVIDRKIETFAKNETGNSYWTAARILADARAIAYYLNTTPSISWYSFKNIGGEDETAAFNVIKNYTNSTLRQRLFDAYRDIATEGRQLRSDIEKYLDTDQVRYLNGKGIL